MRFVSKNFAWNSSDHIATSEPKRLTFIFKRNLFSPLPRLVSSAGKSTTAVNLALALSRVADDKSVGLLDADVFGPSVPKMLNTAGRSADLHQASGLLRPLPAFGLKSMSMGNLTDYEAPIVWRGPMVMGAVERLLRHVAWAPLDILVVDMPPGTGDVQLSIAQNVPVDGAVLVSTPQEVAQVDARKGAAMFAKTDVPVLGLVLNMAAHVCANCGHESRLFGEGRGEEAAARLGAPLLAELPLDSRLSAAGDSGKPLVVTHPDDSLTQTFLELARKVLSGLEAQ